MKEKIKNVKTDIINIKTENSGQGAAEYILLFGGVIVIAIAALLIYRSYFANNQTSLNASNDVNDVRNAMNST
ncbi:class III signal peptide-containing protein [Methanobrevibacter sp. TMH8]|uniref:class III signal peptide-containing protein n=1 Tax=Methanobrevibacter sp. TMH8 TaxID=2848611 RepID=UPI001CCCD769|nr:class III signal peptide-containing protein [Methanobrevibacter sp. TMH8]MBZ9571627.1 class III signal peptide-containing protein [Methanobrevibacter sp. TMH8]